MTREREEGEVDEPVVLFTSERGGEEAAEETRKEISSIRYRRDSLVVLGEGGDTKENVGQEERQEATGKGTKEDPVEVEEEKVGKKRPWSSMSFNGKRKMERQRKEEARKRARLARHTSTSVHAAAEEEEEDEDEKEEEEETFISVSTAAPTTQAADSQLRAIQGKGGSNRAPWRALGQAEPQSLHEDICYFVEWIAPHPAERMARQSLVDHVRKVVHRVCGTEAMAVVFGSFQSDLFLPYSDLDIVVLGATCNSPLFTLAAALRKEGYSERMQLITRARVPLIKFVDPKTGYAVDISFDVPNGPRNTAMVKELLDVYALARPLVLVLKYFLAQRQLNEVYTGGVGSFALILTVISFLQHHIHGRGSPDYGAVLPPERERHRGMVDLGSLLLDYLEFYGMNFNLYMVGLSVRGSGAYFSKMARGWFDHDRPFLLSIEDPSDLENDVAKSSYNILGIRTGFLHAYRSLTTPTPTGAPALLDAIVAPDPASSRKRMEVIEKYKGMLGSALVIADEQQGYDSAALSSALGSASEADSDGKHASHKSQSNDRSGGKKKGQGDRKHSEKKHHKKQHGDKKQKHRHKRHDKPEKRSRSNSQAGGDRQVSFVPDKKRQKGQKGQKRSSSTKTEKSRQGGQSGGKAPWRSRRA